MVVALLLRFFNFSQLPYTHDELSAISRLDYKNLGELIKNGVTPDGHPALVQVFLFYWTKIFGYSEGWVKLPFMLMGIASVVITYFIGVRWFSRTTGLLSAAFLSASQFFIIYSQYARPYISGCFFILIMFYFLLKLLFEVNVSKKDWIFFGVFLLLCAINHHVSMLAAGISGFTGLLFINKERRVSYLVTCLLAVISYLPHIGITMHQFSIGGVGGWLSPPSNDFMLTFLFFLMHYSVLVIVILILIFLSNYFFGEKISAHVYSANKIRFLLLINFILLWLICQFYSVYRNPILQFSSLIFSAPLLVLFIFSFFREISGAKIWISLVALLAVMIFSLHHNRKFFDLNYRQGFERMVEIIKLNHEKYPDKKYAAIVRSEKWFVDFYKRKYHVDFPVLIQPNERQLTLDEIKNFILSVSPDILLCSNIEPQATAFASGFRYQTIDKEQGYSYEIYLLRKSSSCSEIPFKDDIVKKIELKFNIEDTLLTYQREKIFKNYLSEKQNYLQVDTGDTYPLGLKIKLSDLRGEVGDHLLLKLKTDSSHKSSGQLFFNITEKDSSLFYSDTELPEFNFCNYYFSSMFYGLKSGLENGTLTAALFNKHKNRFKIYGFELFLIRSNPYRYGLLEKLKK